MYFKIGCVDGKEYLSDAFPVEDIQEMLDETGGYIGTDDLKDKKFETVDEVIDLVASFAKYDSSNNTQFITLTIDGRDRIFNSRHIIWFEAVR